VRKHLHYGRKPSPQPFDKLSTYLTFFFWLPKEKELTTLVGTYETASRGREIRLLRAGCYHGRSGVQIVPREVWNAGCYSGRGRF